LRFLLPLGTIRTAPTPYARTLALPAVRYALQSAYADLVLLFAMIAACSRGPLLFVISSATALRDSASKRIFESWEIHILSRP
jgi:hypothetical protein